MPHAMHAHSGMWLFRLSLTLAFMLTAWVYFRGWLSLRSSSFNAIQSWRAISFLLGLSVSWAAMASPIASLDVELLTAHMVQHLLLMTFAAPLMVLGASVKPFLFGLPSSIGYAFVRPAVRRPVQRIGRALGRPAV